MRLLGTITPADLGLQFALFLENQGIKTSTDITQNNDWENENYGIPSCNLWITREEDLPKALEWYQRFQENNHDPIFHADKTELAAIKQNRQVQMDEEEALSRFPPIPPPRPARAPSVLGPITMYILLTCIWVFTWEIFTAPEIKKTPPQFPPTAITSPPITLKFLFDYPQAYQLAHDLVEKYGVEPFLGEKPLPAEGQQTYRQYLHTPSWEGIYPDIVAFARGGAQTKILHGPLFEKAREGELWRFVTPIFLHGDILHILFNMLWLLVLGKQMEKRLSAGQYIFFIVVSAIFSNTCQYILSGPNFIGYSGVLCAMIVFVWMRQRYYPWEGYHLEKATINMITVFILGIFALQVVAFFLEAFANINFPVRIANTAHLAGGLIGYLFAQIKSYHLPSPKLSKRN